MVFKLNSHGDELVTNAVRFGPVFSRPSVRSGSHHLIYSSGDLSLIPANQRNSTVISHLHIEAICSNGGEQFRLQRIRGIVGDRRSQFLDRVGVFKEPLTADVQSRDAKVK